MKEKIKSFVKDTFNVVITALLISLFITNFLFSGVEVNGSSMNPMLVDGDRGFGFIITKYFGVNRFDSVVIDNGSYLIVKRVIGLPHEKLEYKGDNLYINDEYVAEDFDHLGEVEDFSIELQEDEYFVLGDNRVVSRDSREHGPYKKTEIKMTHLLIYKPLDNFGFKK